MLEEPDAASKPKARTEFAANEACVSVGFNLQEIGELCYGQWLDFGAVASEVGDDRRVRQNLIDVPVQLLDDALRRLARREDADPLRDINILDAGFGQCRRTSGRTGER